MADEHKPGFKDLFATIKKSPALTITFIAAALIIGYILIKKGPGSGTAAQTTSTDTNSGLNTGGGSYIQPFIEPIVIQSGGGPSPVAVSGGDGGSPAPSTGITMPPASSGSPQGTTGTTNSSANSGSGLFYGILGPNVAINTQNKTYTNANGQTMPLPIPTGATVVQGSANRVWYTYQGNQYLLTSGTGGPQSSAYATGVPVSTANPGTSSSGTTNQQNTTVTKNVNNTPATTNAGG